jgi:hypothetical protein
VNDVRFVPPFAVGSVPVTPVVNGKPVRFVAVPLDGVPSTPPLTKGAPEEPTLTARAVATPVPKPDTPVAIGSPVAFVRVALVGVPRIGVTKVGEVANTADPLPVSSVKAPARLEELNEPKDVALPTEVTAPVKLALVVTLPAVRPEAVPVMFVPTKADGVPKAGVTKVGDVAKTKEPVPVSSVTAEIRFALEGVARKVATPVPRPETPVLIGKPVALVKVPLEGVPRAGVTRVGLLANTKAPDPVSSVTAEAKLADDGVPKKVATPVPKPLTPVEIGRPVAFVNTAELGVPRAGVTSVGEFDNTTLVVPVLVVTPVPPLRTGRVPVMSAVERVTASHEALVPSDWRYLLAAEVWLGNKLFNAPAAVEAPVPPSATAKSVMPVIEPPVIAAAELSVLVAMAVAMLLYSVSISVPRTTLSGSPGVRLSLVAKFVLFV